MIDPYDILGIHRTASEADIKAAYRALAKQYHPDTNRERPDAATKFREVSEAYDLLSDKTRRAMYDWESAAAAPEIIFSEPPRAQPRTDSSFKQKRRRTRAPSSRRGYSPKRAYSPARDGSINELLPRSLEDASRLLVGLDFLLLLGLGFIAVIKLVGFTLHPEGLANHTSVKINGLNIIPLAFLALALSFKVFLSFKTLLTICASVLHYFEQYFFATMVAGFVFLGFMVSIGTGLRHYDNPPVEPVVNKGEQNKPLPRPRPLPPQPVVPPPVERPPDNAPPLNTHSAEPFQ